GRDGLGHQAHDGGVAADLAAFGDQGGDDGLEMGARHVLVDEQGFGRAANAGAAHLGVEGDGDGLVEIGAPVDIDMDQALEMGKDRHAGLGLDPGDQRFAAPGHDDVDIAVEALEHFANRFPVGRGHELDAFHRQAGQMQAIEQAIDNGAGGMEAVAAAAQDDGIARFDAERAGIGGDIGAALENDADDAERGADSLDMKAIGPVPFGNDGADGIGQFGNGPDRLDNAVDAGIGEEEPVEKGTGYALFPRGGHVERIGGENLLAVRVEGAGGGEQSGALLFGRGDLEGVGADPGIAADLAH